MDILKQAVIWIALAACLVPVWGTLLWELWEGAVRPRLIRRDIIDRAAAAILAEHGDLAEQMTWIREDRAWRYSNSFKQGRLAADTKADRGDAAGARNTLAVILRRSPHSGEPRRMATSACAAILRDAARERGSSG